MLIQIKNAKNSWITVKLISINKGGTITIKYKGQLITRKIKRVRWTIVEKVAKKQGVSSDKPSKDKRFKTKKRRHKYKKRSTKSKSTKNDKGKNNNKRRRKVVRIAGHKVDFL